MYLTFEEYSNLAPDLITNSLTSEEYSKMIGNVEETYIDGQLFRLYNTPFKQISTFNSATFNTSTIEKYVEVTNINYKYPIDDTTITFLTGDTYSVSPYTINGVINAGVSITKGTYNLFSLAVISASDFTIGDTIVLDFNYAYPEIVKQLAYNFFTWYYLRNYYTQTTSNKSEWVESFFVEGMKLINGILEGVYSVEGHDRNKGVSSDPQITEGEINV